MSNKVIFLPFFKSKGCWFLEIASLTEYGQCLIDGISLFFLWLSGICVVKVKQNRVTLNPFFKCSFFLVYDNAFFSEMRLIIWNTSKSDY